MKPDNKLVVVYETQGMIRAEIIKAKLESAGIPALLKYESLGPVLAVTVDGLGRVQVLVPQKREQEARDLISESNSSPV